MIVETKPTWLHLVFSWHGSVTPKIWKRVALTTLVAVVVTGVYEYTHPGEHPPMLTLVPFSLIGVALGIFLGFRNNTSYDRFWEGRKLWGRFVNTSRTLARQIITFVEADTPNQHGGVVALRRQMVYQLIAYIHCARLHLRDQLDQLDAELSPLIDEEVLAPLRTSSNAPIMLLATLGKELQQARKVGWIHAYHAPLLEGSLSDLTDIQGGCERIKKTPIPFSYTVLIHRIVAIYCFALPFGIAHEVGYMTPLVVLIVSYTFLGLDAIGDEIEDPFGEDPNDLPLGALSRMIEVNLRETLGESDLPEMHKPDAYNVLL